MQVKVRAVYNLWTFIPCPSMAAVISNVSLIFAFVLLLVLGLGTEAGNAMLLAECRNVLGRPCFVLPVASGLPKPLTVKNAGDMLIRQYLAQRVDRLPDVLERARWDSPSLRLPQFRVMATVPVDH